MAKPKYPQEKALELARINAIHLLGLHKHNTAADRAKAMGYDTKAWHGTQTPDIPSLRRSRTGAQGPGVYLGDDPSVANPYAGDEKGANVIPALLKGKYADNATFSKAVEKHGWAGAEQALKAAGFHGVHDTQFESAYNVFDPTHVRSQFAAFDPARAHEAGLSYKEGGTVTPTTEQMRMALMAKGGKVEAPKETRVQLAAEGPGGVKGIVVPRHMLEGNKKSGVLGMHEINKARAAVYGAENRPPLNVGKIGKIHKDMLAEHFTKPVDEQMAAEDAALKKLKEAKHIGASADTLDKSEKLDTVRHEHGANGKPFIGLASKGVAGHALYTSGHGKNEKHHVVNTCPGQTAGCSGGVDASGVVDTKKGTCFAPNAESQYPAAAVRRACHEQAKHDPAMTKDWILAHTGSLRNAARLADKSDVNLLFRPNVVDETDVSSRHVIRGLNKQRTAEGKPPIVANSYGKTNELHDPENGYHITHSNTGPKTKKGQSISENISRDKQRVQNTVMAADAKGNDFANEDGHKTPPKNSYMVTDVKRKSELDKKMQASIKHIKYWSAGRPTKELNEQEKAEGAEGHFGPKGEVTTPDKAHYGHSTLGDKRYDYQKQHVLHSRLVQVGENKDGTPHMIPSDSRFLDNNFLPKSRFKTKNGKDAGAVVMTTPTESTSNLGHETEFTHHVNAGHIEHAKKNKGEYEIDAPAAQKAAEGKEYVAPKPIQIVKKYAAGGAVNSDLEDDDFHAFPESNNAAQRHLAHRHGVEDAPHPQRKTTPYMSGGPVTQDEMLAHTMLRKAQGGPVDISKIGAEEAPGMDVKEYVSPNDGQGLAVGGVDFQPLTPGQQMLPQQQQPQQQVPQGGPQQPPQPQGAQPMPGAAPGPGQPPMGSPQGPQSNLLALTRQGQAMAAMRANPQPMPRPPIPGMATGGSVAQMRMALLAKGGTTHSIGLTERKL